MLPTSNANTTSHRTQNKVEKELKRADKEYAKAEKGFQKGSIRRAEKHENRGMAHELKADGLTVGSRHGHNEGTRVAMLHNSQLTAAQPTITPIAGPVIIPATSSFPIQGMASTGFEQQGQRGLIGQQDFSQQSYGGQGFAPQSSFGSQQSSFGTQQSSLAPQQQGSLGQQGQQGSFGQQPNTISIPHGPGMTTTITTHANDQRF